MTRRFRVVITDFITDEMHPEREILDDIADVVALNAFTEKELPGRIDQADAVMLYHNLNIGELTFNRIPDCKLVVRCGVGFDNVDCRLARERGIPVANVPDYGTEEVADSAIGFMLAMTRGIHLFDSRLRRGMGPWSYTHAVPIHRLRGRTFGIIGLGRIGTAAAIRAKSLGMQVLFYDPLKSDGHDKAIGVKRVETLEELLSSSLVVSLHCPLTEDTHHIISEASIAKMPRGSFLVNTSRGAVVDLNAIPGAIRSGHLAGAAIDVFPHEPPSDDHPLIVAWRNPNDPCHDRVLINPHSAFYSEEGLLDMRVKGASACRRALLGLPLRNVVN